MLSEGAKKLSEGSYELFSGFTALKDGSNSFKNGITGLSSGSEAIRLGSDSVLEALEAISGGLEAVTGIIDTPEGIKELAEGLARFSEGLMALAGEITTLSESFGMAVGALEGAVDSLPDEMIDISAVSTNPDPYVQALLGAYISQCQAIDGLKSTFEQTRAVFEAAESSLPQLASELSLMSGTLADTAKQAGSAMGDGDGFSQLAELKSSIEQLAQQYLLFDEGLENYTAGVDKLDESYSYINSGINSIYTGSGELYNGMSILSEGMGELSSASGLMASSAQEKADSLISEYDKSDFVPTSFTDPKNETVKSVQFVLITEGIEKAAVQKPTTETTGPVTFWEKLLDLFGLFDR